MKLYVASSWRNVAQPQVVKDLRAAGFEVYDFRNPAPGNCGFSWEQVDDDYTGWEHAATIREQLKHPLAEQGFALDFGAMLEADACVLVLPCGRSAHIEAGYFVGAGKPLAILMADGEPELMHKMAGALCLTLDDVISFLRFAESGRRAA